MKKAISMFSLSLMLIMQAGILSVAGQETPQKVRIKIIKKDGQTTQTVENVEDSDNVVYLARPTTGAGQSTVTITNEMTNTGDNTARKTVTFISTEMSYEGKVVKNAPYSADTSTETIQTLADGNRIIKRNSSKIYRDSEGRTRREMTLAAIGPWVSEGNPHRTIVIYDPVLGEGYTLDPTTHTARKNPNYSELVNKYKESVINYKAEKIEINKQDEGTSNKPSTGSSEEKQQMIFNRRETGASTVTSIVTAGQGESFSPKVTMVDSKKESLGKQNIEGVEAEGTRTTTIIPAGQIGNELPITIVAERWYSPDLQTVILNKIDDPLAGQTIYKLTNINRSEPPKTLFEVPSDYTIKQGGTADLQKMTEVQRMLQQILPN